jgi:hypothetical protein
MDRPMFDSRPTSPRLHAVCASFVLIIICAVRAAAQSADQWRAAGGSTSNNTQSAVSAPDDSAWSAPNGSTSATGAQTGNDASNPLRQTRNPQPVAVPREPRAFNAPATAKPMNKPSTSAAANSAPQPQRQFASNAIATRPAPVAKPVYMLPRTMPGGAQPATQRPTIQSTARSAIRAASNANNSGDDLWQAINVAYQSQPTQKLPSQKKYMPENLPMPGDGDDGMQDPVFRGPTGPDAWHQPVGGPYYQPYGGPAGCCNEAGCPCGGPCCGDGCEPGCGCPCGAPCGEPGCDCEPGCGCPSGPKKEVFCIGPGDDESCHTVQIRWPKWQEVIVFGGVQGFKGPYDRDRDSGNFGFNEGINIGAKVPYAQLGYQIGYRAAESQLNGDIDTGIDKSFLQNFFTAGMFHRQKEGLQFGVVYDALIDERTHSQNFNQLRSEISIINGCHEIGFDATVGLNTHRIEDANQDVLFFQASDQYVLFYRLHGCAGGEGRVYGGFNADSDGILGSDMLIPISDCVGVQGGFAYLIPNEKNGAEGAAHEAWNIGLGLVWHFDHQARKCFNNCYRPMFNVADNGYLIVDQQKSN